ncbi:MAG: hypothetical protein PVJ92_01330 [Candidatus Dependentiae bacterium]|jgi:chromosome segregation ATPase
MNTHKRALSSVCALILASAPLYGDTLEDTIADINTEIKAEASSIKNAAEDLIDAVTPEKSIESRLEKVQSDLEELGEEAASTCADAVESLKKSLSDTSKEAADLSKKTLSYLEAKIALLKDKTLAKERREELLQKLEDVKPS